MVNESELRTLLKQEISNHTEVPPESIDENAHLADLGIDSLQALQFLVLLERLYGITLNDEDLQHFRTVNKIVSLIGNKVTEFEDASEVSEQVETTK